MRGIIKISALLLAVCLLFSACSNAGDTTNNGIAVTVTPMSEQNLVGNIPCEFPLVTDGTTLNIMTVSRDDVDASDIYVWQKYQEMTGVAVNWKTITKSERKEAVNTALANNSQLDLMLRCKISASKLTQYGESGLILDLAKDDMLKTYAPNCWAFLQSHPDALASVTNPDGAIYSLPQVNSGAELRVSRKIFINKKWLEKVNMSVPSTTEEFYQLLKAFKEQDPNGNGDFNDEIPFCPIDWVSVQDAFFGAFGIGNRGNHNMSVDCDEATGKVRFIAASDEYKQFLEYLNKLYSEGLMDNGLFNITSEQWTNYAVNDRIGVFANTNLAGMPADTVDNWVAIEEALEGPNGDKFWSAIRANFHSTGAAVIPSTCSNPELVLRWLDYFWTDEGTLFYHMGLENDTFVVNEDGSYDYAPAIYEEIQSGAKSFDDVIATISPYPGGSNPTVEIAPYFMGGEMAPLPAQAARSLFAYGPKEYWPSFTFTAQENETLAVHESDISKYLETERMSFVTGQKSFSEWDSYVSRLEQIGMNDMLAVYQAALDRYEVLKQAHPTE